MSDRELRAEMFGRDVSFEYSDHWVGYSILSLRIVMGWILFQAGIQKLLDPSWTAAGYLQNVPAGNPLVEVWAVMAGNPMVDALVIWGLTLTGLGLLLGLLVRFSSLGSATMMMLFWASSLEGGIMQGLPLAHGWVVDDHVVYALLLFGLGAFGAGRIVGIDEYLEDTEIVRNNPGLKYLLG